MKAIQYYGPQNIKYEEVPIKPPEDGEIVVKIMSALNNESTAQLEALAAELCK